jgi:hypothetical protein
MSFAAITLCVASQPVFIVVVYVVIDSVRKLLDTPQYVYQLHSYLLHDSKFTQLTSIVETCTPKETAEGQENWGMPH